MRLIDADVANRWMERNGTYIDTEILKAIPTVDAVLVVRCKDCKYNDEGENYIYCCALQTKCPTMLNFSANMVIEEPNYV